MNLRVKFNLAITTCCLICAATTYMFYSTSVQEYSKTIMLNKAQYILDLSDSLSDYNDTQVKPLLLASEQQGFIKQAVSAYAVSSVFSDVATEMGLTKLRVVFKDSQVSLYKANNWQNDIIKIFINDTNKNTYSISKSDENGQFLILASPIVENEITIGAKIVSVYKAPYDAFVKKQLSDFFNILIIVIVLLLMILNILFHWIFFKPMKFLLESSQELSRGQTDEELQVNSNDEISEMAESFNRMQRSLKAAMTMMSK